MPSAEWLSVPLATGFIEFCYGVLMAELGADPSDASTYQNARNVSGYDSTWGWLRSPPAMLQQLYLATHPRLYRLQVGLYARLVLKHDLVGDDGYLRSRPAVPAPHGPVSAVRACLELRLQLYNSKLHLPLPKQKTMRFAHTDCDPMRGGVCDTPAPQCVVFTSPSHARDKQIYGCRFVPLDCDRLRREANRSTAPYVLPRPAAPASVPRDNATKCPEWVDFETQSTRPHRLEVGHLLFFDHLTAHEFTQFEKPTSVPDEEWIRSAEYPSLVCPALHGAAHQAREEVLAALLVGTPPVRSLLPRVRQGGKGVAQGTRTS